MYTCAQRGMTLPNWGQAKVIMQNRIAIGGTISGITAGDAYWTSSSDFGGWAYPVYIVSDYFTASPFDSTTLRVRCVH